MKHPLIFENLCKGYIIYINRQTVFGWGFYVYLLGLHKKQAKDSFSTIGCTTISSVVKMSHQNLAGLLSFCTILRQKMCIVLHLCYTPHPPYTQLHVVFIRFSHNFITISPCLLFHHYPAKCREQTQNKDEFFDENKAGTNYPKLLEYQYINPLLQ